MGRLPWLIFFHRKWRLPDLSSFTESGVNPDLSFFTGSGVIKNLYCLYQTIRSYSSSHHYAPELDIRVKSYEHLNFSRAFIVQFWATRYIIGLDRTSEQKVVAVWIFLVLPCLISSISIYYAPESKIRVKGYHHLNFSRDSVAQFRASRYIMRLNRTSEWKVMNIWISRELPMFNF